LQFTSHYTLPIMGNRRRQLLDADAGVYRYDQLVVLRYARMPALLMEAGSIVNRQEELELRTPERRAATSAAVETAVEQFCAARAQPKTDRMAKRPPARPGTAGSTPPAR
jgi:N-acetylmuramoyl-L-alanine amidase